MKRTYIDNYHTSLTEGLSVQEKVAINTAITMSMESIVDRGDLDTAVCAKCENVGPTEKSITDKCDEILTSIIKHNKGRYTDLRKICEHNYAEMLKCVTRYIETKQVHHMHIAS